MAPTNGHASGAKPSQSQQQKPRPHKNGDHAAASASSSSSSSSSHASASNGAHKKRSNHHDDDHDDAPHGVDAALPQQQQQQQQGDQLEKQKKKKKKTTTAPAAAADDEDNDKNEAAAAAAPKRKHGEEIDDNNNDGGDEPVKGKGKGKKAKRAVQPVADAAAEEEDTGAAAGEGEAEATAAPATTRVAVKSSGVTGTAKKFRQLHSISVEGEDASTGVFEPIQSFASAPFSKASLQFCGQYDKPSPIQSQCWPICAAGHDVVGIAATGSGKTLAFALPGIDHITANKAGGPPKKFADRGARMLVLAPTRELALQIEKVCSEVGKANGVSTVCVYGGVGKESQRKALSQGAQIVVATPGRLLDLVSEGACDLSKVAFLVLDEADRMLDLGFEQDIRAILKQLPTKRQTLMFSATWPTSIQALAAEFLRTPVKVVVGSQDLSANHAVKQIVEVIENDRKEYRLHELLTQYHKSRKNRVLVFVLYKKEAERIERFLFSKGWQPGSIHGDKNQSDRTAALQSFRDGSRPLLIATDVAARGLDIPAVEYVINVTFPLTIEDYVHRIGRTGRAGATGTSHTLFTSFDKSHSGELINVLKEASQPVPEELLKFGSHTKKKEHKLYGAHFKDVDTNVKATKITFDDDD